MHMGLTDTRRNDNLTNKKLITFIGVHMNAFILLPSEFAPTLSYYFVCVEIRQIIRMQHFMEHFHYIANLFPCENREVNYTYHVLTRLHKSYITFDEDQKNILAS